MIYDLCNFASLNKSLGFLQTVRYWCMLNLKKKRQMAFETNFDTNLKQICC